MATKWYRGLHEGVPARLVANGKMEWYLDNGVSNDLGGGNCGTRTLGEADGLDVAAQRVVPLIRGHRCYWVRGCTVEGHGSGKETAGVATGEVQVGGTTRGPREVPGSTRDVVPLEQEDLPRGTVLADHSLEGRVRTLVVAFEQLQRNRLVEEALVQAALVGSSR